MRLTWASVTTHPKRPFKIAPSTRDAFTMVIARLEHDDIFGLGEASPSVRVTGEDATSVGHFLTWAANEVEPLGPDDLLGFLDHVHDDTAGEAEDQAAGPWARGGICGNPSARCALDLAAHDLLGKLRGVPARAFYDLPAGRMASSATVSLEAPDVMADEARAYVAAGWRVLKLKLGEAAHDVERVRAVRAACPHARLRADANASWARTDVALTRALADLGVELVEQPVPADDIKGLVAFAEASTIPVYADEAMLDVHDVERLHEAGFAGGVNVKLQKAGGLRPALRAIRRAKELGYAVQLGCNVETSIGISGAAQLLSLLDHADLDGNALLADDPFVGAYADGGVLSSPDAAGLGIAPRRT